MAAKVCKGTRKNTLSRLPNPCESNETVIKGTSTSQGWESILWNHNLIKGMVLRTNLLSRGRKSDGV